MSDDQPETPSTQPAIKAAEPVDQPSWHGPIADVHARINGHDMRIGHLETQHGEVVKKLDAIESKTDTQTIILSRLDKVAGNPIARAIFVAVGLAIAGWLAHHGIKVEIPN